MTRGRKNPEAELDAALRRALEAGHSHVMRDVCGMPMFPLADPDRYLAEVAPGRIIDGLIASLEAAHRQRAEAIEARREDAAELVRLRQALATMFALAPLPVSEIQMELGL